MASFRLLMTTKTLFPSKATFTLGAWTSVYHLWDKVDPQKVSNGKSHDEHRSLLSRPAEVSATHRRYQQLLLWRHSEVKASEHSWSKQIGLIQSHLCLRDPRGVTHLPDLPISLLAMSPMSTSLNCCKGHRNYLHSSPHNTPVICVNISVLSIPTGTSAESRRLSRLS